MNKIKLSTTSMMFLTLAVVAGLSVFSPAQAQVVNTFPVNDAGISAYVKIDAGQNIDLDLLAKGYETVVSQGASYVIGTVAVVNKPHLYVGLDGWLVAYFLNTEEVAKIAGGTSATTLQDAIEHMSSKLGVTYTDPIKYYNFEFPDANKLTLVKKIIDTGNWENFYVSVPGIVYEASYSAQKTSDINNNVKWFYIDLDNNYFPRFSVSSPVPRYGFYNLSEFTANTIHNINTHCQNCNADFWTALVYKN